MGYVEAVEAAGAKVYEFNQFGSYQGDWYALVKYNSQVGYIKGSYGSCSGCDAFEGEFGYSPENESDYKEKLINFGLNYLDNIMSYEIALANANENIEWDQGAQEIIDWLKRTEKIYTHLKYDDKFTKIVLDKD